MPGLAEGKKRYLLTLTEENMEKAHKAIADAGLPKWILSIYMDEMLQETIIPTLEEIANKRNEGKKLKVPDMFPWLSKEDSKRLK